MYIGPYIAIAVITVGALRANAVEAAVTLAPLPACGDARSSQQSAVGRVNDLPP